MAAHTDDSTAEKWSDQRTGEGGAPWFHQPHSSHAGQWRESRLNPAQRTASVRPVPGNDRLLHQSQLLNHTVPGIIAVFFFRTAARLLSKQSDKDANISFKLSYIHARVEFPSTFVHPFKHGWTRCELVGDCPTNATLRFATPTFALVHLEI